MSLRKVKMGDLIQKYSTEQQQKTTTTSNGPPVPPKDATTSRPIFQRPAVASRPTSPIRPSPIKTIRLVPLSPARVEGLPSILTTPNHSHEVSGRDKENYEIEPTNTEKRQRLGPAADILRNHPNQVLSPTSSNSRLAPRGERTPSPTKQHHHNQTGIGARPISPTKPTAGTSASALLSNMVEKARSRANSPQKHSTITEMTQASAAKSRARAATTSTAYAATRTSRRVSGASVSSEASSTSSVAARRQRPATATGARPGTAASAKRGVMSTIKKGVAATKKAAGGGTKEKAEKAAAAAAPAASGRVLRKRG